MSYQVLARKWRPRTFHELVGQAHVQRALVNALDQGRLHHAYLFTGTRGVGKTTLARILAKCLNCTANGQGEEGVTSTPCGECDSCRSIDEGRFVDLIEVDAASRTKVEDTRELLDNVQYAPTQGRYKVYLIDEVHMLSTSSFNALLKTLEEPPPHVKFLLATTDPQKLPPTVLSRCLQFTLKQMLPERIVEHLAKVLEAESVTFEESALWLLGKAADGSMRDAMSLADQAIAFGQGEVRHVDVAAMLGTLDHRHVLALVEALAEVNAARLLDEVAALGEQAPDFAAVLDDVTGVLHRLAIAQMVPEALDNGHGDRETLLALAARFTAEDIQLYYQIGIQGRGDMEHAPNLRTALEMTLLRMLAFRPQGVPKPAQTPLPLRGDDGSSSPSSSSPEAPPEKSTDHPDNAPEKTLETQKAADSEPLPPEPDDGPLPWEDARDERDDGLYAGPQEPPEISPEIPASTETLTVVPEAQTPAEPDVETEPDVAVDEGESPQESRDSRLTHEDWLDRFEFLGLGGLTRNLAANCVVEADDGEVLTLRLDPTLSAMNAQVHLERIQQALAGAGIPRRLHIEEGVLPEDIETPRQQAERLAAARHAQAVEALASDPHVRQLKEAFGARLIEATVKSGEVEASG